mmetsp:Transcript_6984/g.17885  ORF Transcript_6984/g.17885 Transcript_6984/m.17885 type:complete len:207 (+) Transcript_6984:3131-3751(+)
MENVSANLQTETQGLHCLCHRSQQSYTGSGRRATLPCLSPVLQRKILHRVSQSLDPLHPFLRTNSVTRMEGRREGRRDRQTKGTRETKKKNISPFFTRRWNKAHANEIDTRRGNLLHQRSFKLDVSTGQTEPKEPDELHHRDSTIATSFLETQLALFCGKTQILFPFHSERMDGQRRGGAPKLVRVQLGSSTCSCTQRNSRSCHWF